MLDLVLSAAGGAFLLASMALAVQVDRDEARGMATPGPGARGRPPEDGPERRLRIVRLAG